MKVVTRPCGGVAAVSLGIPGVNYPLLLVALLGGTGGGSPPRVSPFWGDTIYYDVKP